MIHFQIYREKLNSYFLWIGKRIINIDQHHKNVLRDEKTWNGWKENTAKGLI